MPTEYRTADTNTAKLNNWQNYHMFDVYTYITRYCFVKEYKKTYRITSPATALMRLRY